MHEPKLLMSTNRRRRISCGFILVAWEKLPSSPRRSRSAAGAATAAASWSVLTARARIAQLTISPFVNPIADHD